MISTIIHILRYPARPFARKPETSVHIFFKTFVILTGVLAALLDSADGDNHKYRVICSGLGGIALADGTIPMVRK